MYPDAQEMLDNLSKTREFWHDQIKCASPPLSENEPEGDDPGNIEDNEHPVEGASTIVVPKTIMEDSSMNCSDESDLQTCPVESGDADTCSLQSSTDSLANMKRYIICGRGGEGMEGVKERRGEREGGRERGRERERERERERVHLIYYRHCVFL